MQLMLVRMDQKLGVVFTLSVCLISSTNAFDVRRAPGFSNNGGNMMLPKEVIRPVEPRVWFRPNIRMEPNLPPHPLPPYSPQTRVIVARLDDGRPYGLIGIPDKMPLPNDMVLKDLKGIESIKQASTELLHQTVEKGTVASESLKDEVTQKSVPMPMKPMGRLDVLQDMKKELKEAGLIKKSLGPNAMKTVVPTPSVEKLENIVDLKEHVDEAATDKSETLSSPQHVLLPKELDGVLEMKDGLISFPVHKLAEIAELLKHLKEAGSKNIPLGAPIEKMSDISDKSEDLKDTVAEKASLPLETANDLKSNPLEKADDLIHMPLQKLDDAMDLKSLPVDKASTSVGIVEDAKNISLQKSEDILDVVMHAPLEKIPAATEVIESVKHAATDKLLTPLENTPKNSEVLDMKSNLVSTPTEKSNHALDLKHEVVSMPAEKITEVGELVSNKKEAPMEVVDALKHLPTEKVENVNDLKHDLMEEAPISKVEHASEIMEDIKDATADKIAAPMEILDHLKDIPAQKSEDVLDIKESVPSTPIDKDSDLKDVSQDHMDDLKDIVTNAFEQSFTGDRKDYFKRIVSMMNKDELTDLQEALLSAVSGMAAPKVVDAKNDLQEAVHELIETKDDKAMDPERKDMLEEIEHVLEEMKAPVEANKDTLSLAKPKSMSIPMIQEKVLSAAHSMGSLLPKQDNLLSSNKYLSSTPGQGHLNVGNDDLMMRTQSIQTRGIGMRNEPLPMMRARGMITISHPGRRVSKRSIVYGTGTVAQELRDFPSPSRLTFPMFTTYRQINNAGPPDPYPRSKDALNLPLLDITEPATDRIMEEIKDGLQYVFQTKNEFTLAIHGTGTNGAHTVLDNLIEPEDKVLVFIHGYWGDMLANMSERLGAHVIRYKTSPGSRFSFEEIESALRKHRPDVVAVVYGESSTTVYQPLDGIGDLCRKYGALLVVDVVAVAGMQPVLMDKNKLDAVYCSSNKGLGGVAGLAPVSLSPRAVEKLKNRVNPPRAYQTDLLLQAELWNTSNPDRVHFQSLSLPLMYALREALATIADERMENTFRRHSQATDVLYRGMDALGLEHYVKNPKDRMIGITAIRPPTGKDPKKIADFMFKKYNVVVSSGLGPTEGKVIRIATFATNADSLRVTNVLRALKGALNSRETNRTY